MERSDPRYQAYVEILKEELIPAMGCTEPIALAYAAARAREVLGALPESVQLQVSGSIIKNVKSVIVPNTGHLKGMEAAVAAGIIAGSADRELEVISEVSEDKQAAIRDYMQTVPISIQHIEQGHVFDIIVTERSGDSYAKVRIADFHTNICLIEKNGRVLYEKPLLNEEARRDSRVDRSLLNMKDIWTLPRPPTCRMWRTCWNARSAITTPLQRRAFWATMARTSAGCCFLPMATMCLSGPRPRRPPVRMPA